MVRQKKVVQPVVASPWLIRAAVVAALAVLAGGAGAWVSNVNTKTSEASTVNAVQQVKIEDNADDMEEVKVGLRRIEDKIDNLK